MQRPITTASGTAEHPAQPWARRRRALSLRTRISMVLAVAVTLPIIAWAAVFTRRSQLDAEAALASHTRTVAARLCAATDQYIDKHRAAIASLAGAISQTQLVRSPSLDRHLDALHQTYPGFRSLLIAEGRGRVLSGSPQLLADGRRVVDAIPGVADRPYFVEPMRTGAPFVSEAFLGRGFGQDPIVALSAPILDARGLTHGVVEGSMDLGAFESIGRQLSARLPLRYLLVDRQARLIYANGAPTLPALAPVETLPALRAVRASTGTMLSYVEPGGDPRLGAWCSTQTGWTLVATQSLQPLLSERWQRYFTVAGWTAVALAAALLTAARLARSVTGPLENLGAAVKSFDPRGAVPSLMTNGSEPRELVVLINRFNGMALRINDADRQLHGALKASERAQQELSSVLADRERVIAERTAELARRTEDLSVANIELERLARTDALTGLANRRAWLDALALAGQAATREEASLTVMVVDVDHFKQYNDAYGHPAGDDCLRRVANALSLAARRPLDAVGRLGGEEFGIALFGASPNAAATLADRVRHAVERLAIAHRDSPDGTVTVSIGVATTDAPRDDAALALLEQADAALYEAKRAGRNRVVLASPAAGVAAGETAPDFR